MATRPELLIVGAGPAGVSAALWARSLDLRARVIDDRESVGGTLHHVHFVLRDVSGVRDATGAELAATYARQLEDAAVPVRLGVRVVGFARAGGADAADAGAARAGDRLAADGTAAPVAVLSSAGERIEADALLIATGTRRRRLEIPGEREFEDRGVSYSANRDRELLRGRTVAVAGGGDAAFANALILAGLGCDVTLIVRQAPRARREFRERVDAAATIRVLTHTKVSAIEGTGHVEALVLEGAAGTTRLAVQAIVIKAGVIPNSEWLADAVARDAQGYVTVDPRQRTSRARVWAAGDVAGPALPSIAVAGGGAALALADIRAELKGAAGN